MGNQNSGRMRGVWSRYTPASSPFGKVYLDKTYKFPSIDQLEKFDEDVQKLKDYYAKGGCLIDDKNEELAFTDAIAHIYNRKFEKWLKTE